MGPTLKLVLHKYDWMMWTDQDTDRSVSDSLEHGNQSSGSRKGSEFDEMTKYKHIKGCSKDGYSFRE